MKNAEQKRELQLLDRILVLTLTAAFMAWGSALYSLFRFFKG